MIITMVDKIQIRLSKQLKGFKESNQYIAQKTILNKIVLQIEEMNEKEIHEGRTIDDALEFDMAMQIKMNHITTAFTLHAKTMTDFIKERFKISTGFIKS